MLIVILNALFVCVLVCVVLLYTEKMNLELNRNKSASVNNIVCYLYLII